MNYFYEHNWRRYDTHGAYSLTAIVSNAGFNIEHTRTLPKNAELVLYSAMSSELKDYVEFDIKLKKNNPYAVSIIGGSGITLDPLAVKESSIDYICVGEGETALFDWLLYKDEKHNICKNGQLPQAYNKFVDLDSLPFPLRSQRYKIDKLARNNPSKQFLSGRGCPYSCTYCFNHVFNNMFKDCGKIVRKKSVTYLIQEIQSVKRNYPLNFVVFNDDTFIIDKTWLKQFADKFPSTGIPYSCNIRANLVDEETIRALKESGCKAVNWSIETANDSTRNDILKRNMTREQILNTASLLHKYKIKFRIGNIIGLPNESWSQMLDTMYLNYQCNPNLALATIFTPYPKLELTSYAKETGAYNETSNIPKTIWNRSVLNFDDGLKDKMLKLLYVFPLLSKFPNILWLMKLPKWVLYLIYQAVYLTGMARLYNVFNVKLTKARFLFYMISLMVCFTLLLMGSDYNISHSTDYYIKNDKLIAVLNGKGYIVPTVFNNENYLIHCAKRNMNNDLAVHKFSTANHFMPYKERE